MLLDKIFRSFLGKFSTDSHITTPLWLILQVQGTQSCIKLVNKLSLTILVTRSTTGAYPGFCSMKRLGVLLPLLDEMLVHRR